MHITFFIILSVVCFYLVYLYNRYLWGELHSINIESQGHEEQLNLLMNRDKNLRERNRQLEQGLNETVTIYEYIKKLGSTMDFSEAISTLEGTLITLCPFTSGKIILMEDHSISKVYCLPSTSNQELREYEKNLALKILKNPQTLLYEKGKLSPLGAFPKDVETLLTLPLAVEKELLGIIILENLPLTITDKIHFIALQFAMEVKKTQLFEKVKQLSTIDGLTGLYLRRHFMELLSNELDRGYRQNQPLSFLMVDVDYFKRYNDEYGHLVGDLILKELGSILKIKSREVDILCRYGGDEFTLALPRTNLRDAHIVAERLRRAINEHLFQIAKEQFQIAISIGVSTCNPKDMRLDEISQMIIDLADKALYQAKSQGRNRVVLAT